MIPRVPGHLLAENPDLPNLGPEGRFKRIAEMRHKCRMAAIETEANAKIRKTLIGRSRPMRGKYVPGDLVYYWRAGTGVHQAQGQWLGPARVIGIEGGNLLVSHRATAIKCAKEQLRMASPAEREMREMLMRIEGDDPDERSKHGVPRQQDRTQQQPPPQSSSQKQQPPPQSPSPGQNQQSRQVPRQQPFHQEPGPQVKQDAPRQEPIHQQQESEQNQEPQQTQRQKQRVRVQDDSDAGGRGKRLRVITRDPTKRDPQKMETDQESQSFPAPHEFARRFDGKKQLALPHVPEDDDLNATVIVVMTDIEVLLGGSSMIDVFTVNSARRKRVEVSERKMTETDRSLLKKSKELDLQSWLDHRVFDLVKKKFVDQEKIMRARWVLTWKSSGEAKARLCVLGFQDPDLTEVPRDSPTLSTASEALIMQWVASHKYRLVPGDMKTAF